jgi:hypothetical protein
VGRKGEADVSHLACKGGSGVSSVKGNVRHVTVRAPARLLFQGARRTVLQIVHLQIVPVRKRSGRDRTCSERAWLRVSRISRDSQGHTSSVTRPSCIQPTMPRLACLIRSSAARSHEVITVLISQARGLRHVPDRKKGQKADGTCTPCSLFSHHQLLLAFPHAADVKINRVAQIDARIAVLEVDVP